MAINLRQSLKLTQQLLMTPQLQQAIKLLQLSRLELEQFVANQLAENPVLEEGLTESQEEATQVEREREQSEDQILADRMAEAGNLMDSSGSEQGDMDWDQVSRIKESAQSSSRVASRSDDEMPNYENIVTKPSTLADFLMTQIGEMDFDEQEQDIASAIVGNIDEKGYLSATVEEIAESEEVSVDSVEDVLDTIQRLDPPGVAARDLKECLLLQIRNGRLKNGIVEKIIQNHMGELENRNYPAIAKALKIPMEKVIENIQIIADLEPVPGRQFGGDQTQVVIPDVYVFKLGNEWVVTLNEDGLPQLRVNDYYKEVMDVSTTGSSDKTYLQEKMKSAVWLIKSIQQRQRTIFKVAESILVRQKDFFEKGVEYLKPMILKDIADDIEMHESTISRVTSNKYMHTPRGIFELKYFFNSSVTRADGQSLASESVKSMISEIVKKEEPRKPFSDQKIVDLLEERGIQLARRTVAKYREQLGILPSSKRKKYF